MSGKTLIIVESPAKCKKIEGYLGNNYKVIASYGHFTKLDDLSQIDFETYNIKYKVSNQKVVKSMKEWIDKSDEVIIATDDDREGEAIGWTICKFCKLDPKTTKKISFQEITQTALLKSLENVHHLDMNRVKSQQTRQILDIYLGYKISPILWKYVKHKLSAGRCQTPALRILYDKEMELEALNNDTEYKVTMNLTGKRIDFILTDFVSKDNIQEFIDEIKDKTKWIISNVKQRASRETPPNVLTTSTLQQIAFNKLKMSPKKTMSCAQELYENGLITYMRTDNSCYSADFVESLKGHIKDNYGENYLAESINNLTTNKNNKNAQEAHEGIRVCDLTKVDSCLPNPSSNRLYNMIYKHCIQCGMADHLCRVYDYLVDHCENMKFKYTEREIIFQGWKLLDATEPKPTYKSYLDLLYSSQEYLKMNYLTATEKLIHSINHLSEASLVQKLEGLNIGRPSTFSSIVQGLQDKKYATKGNIEGKTINVTNYTIDESRDVSIEQTKKCLNSEKSKLKITPIGKQVVEFCFRHFSELFDYDFTNSMEELLDCIEFNTKNNKAVLGDYIDQVDKMIATASREYDENPDKVSKVKDVSLHCGKINATVSYIKLGKYGYYLTYGKDKISLKEFSGFDIEKRIADGGELDSDEIEKLAEFIKKRDEKKTTSILIELSPDCSIRQSKYGVYIYYKSKKMKQPKFYKYNDERDANVELRDKWIQDKSIEEIRDYISQKYKLSI